MEKLIDELFSEDDFDQLNAKWHSNYRRKWIILVEQVNNDKLKVDKLLKLVEYFINKSNLVEKFFYPNIKILDSEEIQNNLFYIIKNIFDDIEIQNLSTIQKLDLLEVLLQSRLKFFIGLAFGHLVYEIHSYRMYENFSEDECNRFNKLFEINLFPLIYNCEIKDSSEEMIFIVIIINVTFYF